MDKKVDPGKEGAVEIRFLFLSPPPPHEDQGLTNSPA